MGFDWPDSFSEVPLVTGIDGKTVHFKDGSRREVDAIILCAHGGLAVDAGFITPLMDHAGHHIAPVLLGHPGAHGLPVMSSVEPLPTSMIIRSVGNSGVRFSNSTAFTLT